MEFEWHDVKRGANLRKHDFEDAIPIFEGPVLEIRSDRADEERYRAIGVLEGLEITVVYTPQGATGGSSQHGGHERMSEQRITKRPLANRRRGRTDWDRVRAMSEEEIEANSAADLDNPPWTEAELQAAELALPSDELKVPVSIRLDAEVLDYFKEGGRGYQSRINAVLRGYVRSRRRGRKA